MKNKFISRTFTFHTQVTKDKLLTCSRSNTTKFNSNAGPLVLILFALHVCVQKYYYYCHCHRVAHYIIMIQY